MSNDIDRNTISQLIATLFILCLYYSLEKYVYEGTLLRLFAFPQKRILGIVSAADT